MEHGPTMDRPWTHHEYITHPPSTHHGPTMDPSRVTMEVTWG